jgi:hypothetical protein
LRRTYLDIVEDYLKKVSRLCATLGVDYTLMNTKESLDAALSRYLAFRQRHTRRARKR